MNSENLIPPKLCERVLVTGGSGFLGRAIIKRLAARGDQVCSLTRNHSEALKKMGVDQITGDIGNAVIVEQACRGRDLVFHAAAKPPPWGKYEDYYLTNVTGTHNVLKACLAQNVSRLVYTSTPSVIFNGSDLAGVDESYPYPSRYTAYYPKTKAIAEKSVVKAGGENLKTIILRPHEIWGPEDPHFVPRLLKQAKKLKRIGNGRNLVDTLYIDNAADAHVRAADKLRENPHLSGRIYFITQDEPIPAWDMINAIMKAAGHDPVKGSIPFRAAWLMGALLEFFYRTFGLSGEPPLTRFLVEALATSHWFDISAAKRDLGYSPTVSTAEGLRQLSAWLKEDTQKETNQ